MNRVPWHEYFMLLAKMVALRSGCNSRPSGAIIVKEKRILATGYNGPMPGAWHCIDKGPGYCFRREKGIPDIDKYNFCRATHAEANAIAQAARFGISVEGADLYCTLAPCYVCLKLIASAGIKAVYYEYDYGSRDFSRDLFWKEAIKEAGLEEFKQVKVSKEALKELQEIIEYPTSKRRLSPTDFLEDWESEKKYAFSSIEVLLNKLRYQTGPREINNISFLIEKPSQVENALSECLIFVEGQQLKSCKILKSLLSNLPSQGEQLALYIKIDKENIPLNFRLDKNLLIITIQKIEINIFRKIVPLLSHLTYKLGQEFSSPLRLQINLALLIV